MDQESVYTGLLFFSLLYVPIEIVLSIVINILSRRNEYGADRFAAETIDNPRGLIDALKKLHTTNLSNMTPHPLYVFLNYSHPPLLQRVQFIQEIVELPSKNRSK
jgi:STE24 endopeptidase